VKRTICPSPLLVLLSAFVALAAPRAAAQCTPGPHSGTITADQTWCAADSPHVLTGVVTVVPGVTLTIEAGSTVKPAAITVQGHLAAVGTAANPITFTADGSGWESLTFSGGTGLLRYVDVLKAGWNAPGIVVSNVAAPGVALEHCNLGPGNRGMTITESVVSITDSKIEGLATFAGAYPIVVAGADSRLTLENDTFVGNWSNRIVIEAGAMTSADFTLASQSGLEAYVLGGGYEVPAGRVSTFGAGTTVIPTGHLTVKGKLVTSGTESSPVVIGSSADWDGLFFEGGTGLLSHARLLNAGHNSQGITVRNVPAPGVVLDHASLGQQSQGIAVVDSALTVRDSSIETTRTGFYAIAVSGATSVLAVSGTAFSGTDDVARRILIAAGAMTNADFTLAPQNGLEAFQLGNDYTIPAGRTVTVEAGTTVYQNGGLHIQGRLVTNGTAAAPITITNGYRWTGLFFDGGTGRLAHTKVTNAGFNTAGITVTDVPTPGVVLDGVTLGPGNGALSITDGVVAVNGSTFTGIGDAYALYVRGASSRLTLSGNTFASNTRNQVHLYRDALTGADFTLVPQSGLDAWHLEGDFAIPAGRTVTIEPGVTVYPDGGLHVLGRLVANGTAGQPVTLTHGYRWNGVFFDGGTGSLTWSRITNAGFNTAALTATNVPLPGVVLDHASIGPGNDGIVSTDSVLVVRDSSFEVNLNGRYAIHVHGPGSTLSLSNNIFGGTGDYGRRIGLAAGAMTGSDVTLVPQQGLGGYLFGSEYTVPAGRTLTAEAGTPLIATSPLVVHGRFVTRGTAARPVTIDGYRWAIDIDGGTGDLMGAVLRDGGFNYPAVAVRNGGSLLLERTRLHDCNIVRSENSTVTLRNVAFLGGYPGQLEVDLASSATVVHTTFARANGTAVVVANGSTATFTNTIVATCARGVVTDATAAATLTNTLWDSVPTRTSGSVTQHGLIVGSAAFEADGFHVGPTSAALAQGVVTNVADDLDGEARPRPAGLLADLGADESDGGTLIPGRTATPIAVGETKNGTAAAGAFADFVFQVPPGSTSSLKVRAEAESGAAGFRLLVRHRQFPLATLFEAEGAEAGSDAREIEFPPPASGPWYVSVLSSGAAVSFTLSIDSTDAVRRVTAISPGSGGSAGTVTCRVSGTSFEPGSRIELRRSGVPLRTFVPKHVAPSEMTVILDLSGLPPGRSDVAVLWPDGEERLLSDAFSILEGGASSLSVRLIVPDVARPQRVMTILLTYENTGSVDTPAPVLSIRSREGLGMRLDPADPFVRGPVNVLGIDHHGAGTAGTLPPGVQQWIPVQVFCEGPNHLKLGFDVSALSEEPAASIDWESLESAFRLPDAPADGWAGLWGRLRARVGSTWGDFAETLRRDADALSDRGRFVSSSSRLLGFEMSQLYGNLLRADLAVAIDVAAPSTGPDLALARVFPADVLSRFRLGPWGRGWTNLYWDVRAVELERGEVQVRSGSGGVRAFRPLVSGGFRGRPGDWGRLTRTATGFALTERNGSVSGFDAAGRLAFQRDLFDDEVVLGYDGAGRLSTITHSSGDSLTLHYGATGRVSHVVDHTGLATTYGYDGSGEHLLTVTTPTGLVTRYDYVSAPGSPSDHALASVTRPDGTVRFFSFDSAGRNSGRHSSGGAEPISFEADDEGRITTRDGAGRSWESTFDESGRLVAVRNPLGQTVRMDHDAEGDLIRVVDPAGGFSETAYGLLHEITSAVGPSGSRVDLAYRYPSAGGAFPKTLADPGTNESTFSLDLYGRIASTTYPDGSTETVSFDDRGFPVTATNRNGQTTTLSWNRRGQIVRKELPGGVAETYAFDSNGDASGASGPAGTITVERDARRFPRRVTGVDGHPIVYDRDDAGRLTKRTEEDGFAVVYERDAAGRLSRILDGSAGLIVSYEYDAAGRLSLERKGNGTSTAYRYDAAGRVESVENRGPASEPLSTFSYTYDPNGNPISVATAAGTTLYRYDAASRLAGVTRPDGAETTFEWDPSGNRVTVTESSAATAYTHDALNRVLTAGTATFDYDAAGQLLRRTDGSGTTTYDWDAQGQLVRVVHPTLGTYTYDYDPLGRRVAEHHGAQSRVWTWDGWTITAEHDGAGQLVARYVSGLGLVARIDGSGGASYFAFDASGHTSQLTDGSGAVVCSYDYGPFGEPVTATELVPNPFRYAGRFGVVSDPHGLLQMRARSYDPALGRFISPDPLRYGAGFHLYDYVGGNPVRYSDPSGLENPGAAMKDWLIDGTDVVLGLFADSLGSYFAPVSIGNSLAGAAGDFKDSARPGQGWAFVHGVGQLGSAGVGAIWTMTSLMASVECTTTVGGVAVAGGATALAASPVGWVILGAGAVIAIDELATNAYIENLKREERWFLEHPVARNPWAKYSQDRRPDGSYPDWVMRLVARETGRPELVSPGDPNGKTATPGTGPRHRVRSGDLLTYAVHFQNVPSASAPAQEVFLTDALDPALDLPTLRVTDVGWGIEALETPLDTPSFTLMSRREDWRPDHGKRWWVETSSALTGSTLRLRLRTLDPETGDLPEDPLAGFLPPDDATGRGQGVLTFSVRTKTGLAPGTRIANSATIVFDTEAPITTNEVFHMIGLPGDANDDGVVNPADVFYLVAFLYSGGPEPPGVADANFDERVDALDLFFLINYLYAGGPEPE